MYIKYTVYVCRSLSGMCCIKRLFTYIVYYTFIFIHMFLCTLNGMSILFRYYFSIKKIRKKKFNNKLDEHKNNNKK